jgi:1-acyl-sn-glycerol-3-phosphate acyltransferase
MMSRLHKPNAGFWIRTWVSILYPLDGLLFKIRWRHLERVPAPDQGGVIIALNHTSQIDTVLMARLVWQSGRVPRFMIKAGVFGWPIVGFMMKGAGQIPVYRGTADAAQSLRDAVSALARGEAIVIYPEGTTTKDPAGWPMQAKTGIARLVLLSPHTPVVPVGQWGAQHRRGTKKKVERGLFGRRVHTAMAGEPLDMSKYAAAEPTGVVLRQITDEIMGAVQTQVAELRGESPPPEFFKPARVYVDKG